MQRDPRIRPQFPAEEPLTDSAAVGGPGAAGGNGRRTARTRRDDLDDWAALVPGRAPATSTPTVRPAVRPAVRPDWAAPTPAEWTRDPADDREIGFGGLGRGERFAAAVSQGEIGEVLELLLEGDDRDEGAEAPDALEGTTLTGLVRPPRVGHPAEQKRQHFADAVRDLQQAMAKRAPESRLRTDAAALLPLLDAETAKSLFGLTAEAVLAELIRGAHRHDAEAEEGSAGNVGNPASPDFFAARIREAADRAEAKLAKRIRDLRKAPTAEAFTQRLEAVLTERRPAGLSRRGLHPWAARFEGELVPKTVWRALGLVRWARSLSPERAERITILIDELFEKAGISAEDASAGTLAFAQGRPIVFIGDFSSLSVKLVRDLWAAEPRVAVAAVGRAAEALKAGNPLAAFRIPVIPDPQGLLAAMLAVEALPALSERITGGIRVTAPAGLPSLGLLPETPCPQWLLTLAELGMVSRWDGAYAEVPAPKSLQAKAAFCRAFLRLLDVPGQTPAVPKALRGIDRAQRERYLKDREALRRILGKELQRVEKALAHRAKARAAEVRALERAVGTDAVDASSTTAFNAPAGAAD
ncbi:MAG: hypothetical protein SPH18_03945 [Sutterella parvirubra]|nr:hypothetical protein [Sutterella parvirubra]